MVSSTHETMEKDINFHDKHQSQVMHSGCSQKPCPFDSILHDYDDEANKQRTV